MKKKLKALKKPVRATKATPLRAASKPVRDSSEAQKMALAAAAAALDKKAMGVEIRSWHLARRSDKSLLDLARMFNNIVQGWINYYGRFYKSELMHFLEQQINAFLVKWMVRKYKRLRRRERRAMAWLAVVAQRAPRLFAHWRFGARPDGWAMGAR